MQNKQNMKDFVINLLKDHLSENYHYHNYLHTLYVTEKVLEIGRQEACSDKELELLYTAALWHDTGYIRTYKNHEEESCLLARQYLPEYGYNSLDIDKVCSLIMVTKIPQTPKNKLDTILADADLEYLGTESFNIKADDLFKELHYLNPLLTPEKWNQQQISFLQNHHFFTRFCQETKEPVKQMVLQKLIEHKT